jgi:hypothetical protein
MRSTGARAACASKLVVVSRTAPVSCSILRRWNAARPLLELPDEFDMTARAQPHLTERML